MLRVFLVEDESTIRETLRDTVPWAQCGYEFAGEAGDGEMALPLIRQAKPDVLITDIKMPFMDGLDLSRLVLREFPNVKIVIISGYDDFEYARQAIDIGVERFLLKPVTKNSLMGVLDELREKVKGERAQHNYLTQFHQEAQEYEQYARRRFFERMVGGQLTVQQIYEEAAKLDLDLRAQCYTIALFSILPKEAGESYSEPAARVRDALLEHFMKYPEYLLLRWNLNTYVVLIKADKDKMDGCIRRCIDSVREQYESCAPDQSWSLAMGTPTQRLSALPACFEEVSRLWACRYILPRQHVLSAETVGFLTRQDDGDNLAGLDPAKVNPSIWQGVLQSAAAEEIPSFVDEYLLSLSQALGSQPFCQYLMLSVRFTATAFVTGLGVSPEEFFSLLDCLELTGQNVTQGDLKHYLTQVLFQAATLRDKASSSQYGSLLGQAVEFIDSHFTDDSLSLNLVAREINISANYLSAVFSQEMGVTFTEYVTGKRMEKARELLRSTDKRSGEIAFAVGYRDPHYFSFLFKKTQGCTPRDYRAGGGRRA